MDRYLPKEIIQEIVSYLIGCYVVISCYMEETKDLITFTTSNNSMATAKVNLKSLVSMIC